MTQTHGFTAQVANYGREMEEGGENTNEERKEGGSSGTWQKVCKFWDLQQLQQVFPYRTELHLTRVDPQPRNRDYKRLMAGTGSQFPESRVPLSCCWILVIITGCIGLHYDVLKLYSVKVSIGQR